MTQLAPEGCVWVCAACGKRSRDQYGEQPISHGWDESCVLNSVLCREDHLVLNEFHRVVEVKDGGLVQ